MGGCKGTWRLGWLSYPCPLFYLPLIPACPALVRGAGPACRHRVMPLHAVHSNTSLDKTTASASEWTLIAPSPNSRDIPNREGRLGCYEPRGAARLPAFSFPVWFHSSPASAEDQIC